MAGKITVTFQNGRHRVLKTPEEFYKIDKNRKAMFVMNNLRVFEGYSDGEVDEAGDFGIFGTIYGITLPFERMLGWCYESTDRKSRKKK
ncbi:hypothetical protein [uncultured Duncaniella sp.]|uniref:hypothetical protein n=1 Tax=uncultured Duncaniella sp. TaxID=2768039 RepID=UPI0026705FC8|nr:hypothetical protein [uncultured Duncaniella sp.]